MMCTLLLSSPLFFIPDSAANPLDEKSPFSKEETCSLRTLISVEWIINKTNGNIKITWTYHLTISFLCLGSHILLLLIQWAEAGEPQTQQHWLTCWVGAFFSSYMRVELVDFARLDCLRRALTKRARCEIHFLILFCIVCSSSAYLYDSYECRALLHSCCTVTLHWGEVSFLFSVMSLGLFLLRYAFRSKLPPLSFHVYIINKIDKVELRVLYWRSIPLE